MQAGRDRFHSGETKECDRDTAQQDAVDVIVQSRTAPNDANCRSAGSRRDGFNSDLRLIRGAVNTKHATRWQAGRKMTMAVLDGRSCWTALSNFLWLTMSTAAAND